MPRILHLCPTPGPGWPARQVNLLLPRLIEVGYDIHLCAAMSDRADASWVAAPVTPGVFSGRPGLDVKELTTLRERVRQLRPDLVHLWLSGESTKHRLLPLVDAGTRWLASHSTWSQTTSWLARLVQRRWLYPRIVSTLADPAALERFGAEFPTTRVEHIASGVAPSAARNDARRALLAELELPDAVFLIGAVGKLRLERRIKDLIWAADMLKFIRDDVHLLICGDGPHRTRLERFRSQVRIEDKVHFLGNRADVLDLLPGFDVFWSAREDCGQPLALLEAMAAGVPAIGTRIPGAEEAIEHGRSGFLVTVGERAAFARITQRLLEDRPLAAMVGAAGRDHVLEHFSAARMTDRFLDLYERLLAT